MNESTRNVVPAEQYLAGLNRKRMAAGVLFRDRRGWVLLVEPSYQPGWEIPGGAVEAGESPWTCAARELAEELGLEQPIGRLLLVDYVPVLESRPEAVVFIFDGGILDETDIPGLVFADGEIVSAAFHAPEEIRGKVKPVLADRIEIALQAVAQGGTALCELGRRVA